MEGFFDECELPFRKSLLQSASSTHVSHKNNTMIQRVLVIGATGNVGMETIRQICEKDDSRHAHINPTDIIGIANTTHMRIQRGGLPTDMLLRATQSRDFMKEYLEGGKQRYEMMDLLAEIKDEGLDGDTIFIDATSSTDEALAFHLATLNDSHNRIVTANKNPVSRGTIREFDQLAGNRRYNFDTTVMAGGGAIDFANRRLDICDQVEKIEGMLSGTMGYILSELEKGDKTFSDIVREAQEKGYTEPNPFDDLNGLDVARKLTILARSCGYQVGFDQVEVEPLVDPRFGELKGEDFWKELPSENERLIGKCHEAGKKGEVLRYTGKMERGEHGEIKLSVGLRSYKKSSPFGILQGTQNLVTYKTGGIGEHTIISPGAGLEITAMSIRAAIAKMIPDNFRRL